MQLLNPQYFGWIELYRPKKIECHQVVFVLLVKAWPLLDAARYLFCVNSPSLIINHIHHKELGMLNEAYLLPSSVL